MKKVLILFGKTSIKNKTPFKNDKYRICYEYFYDLARENELDFYRASYAWYDPDKKIFKYAWTYKNGKWQKVKNIIPDIIYDKATPSLESHYFKSVIGMSFKILNDPRFTLLANNKFYTSLLFPKYFKKSYRVSTKKELSELVNIFDTKKVVLKPTRGSGGDGVKIINKKEISSLGRLESGIIAQEFVDSSNGIDGITEGTHDLRLVFVNNELIYCYIRQPKKGSLLANVSQGGSMQIIGRQEMPTSIHQLIDDVQSTFNQYPQKIYTIDLIFDKNQRPWIVELNTMPGIYFYPEQKKWQDRLYIGIINLLKNNT